MILTMVGTALLGEVSSLGRDGHPRVDLNARKEYYRQRLKDGCIQHPPPPNPREYICLGKEKYKSNVVVIIHEEYFSSMKARTKYHCLSASGQA